MNDRLGVTTLTGIAVAALACWWAWGGGGEPAPLARPRGYVALERPPERAARDAFLLRARRGSGDAATPTATTPRAPTRVASKSLMGGSDRGALPGDPAVVDRFLEAHDQAELTLHAALSRRGITAPPELAELLTLRRRGATPPELLAFVRARFPRDMRLRLATAQWIEGLAGPGPGLALRPRRPRRPEGSVGPADAGATEVDASGVP